MKKYLYCSLFLVMAMCQPAAAKPSELPTDNQIQCPECGGESQKRNLSIQLGVGSGGVTLEVQANYPAQAFAGLTAIDAVTPACVEQLLKLSGEMLAGRLGDATPLAGDPDGQAARLFQIAELYTRTGHLGAACTCFQHVHMLAPTTRLGRLAIDRLLQLEERMRDASEPSEEPAPVTPRESFRRIREGSMPLGLVQVSY